VDSVSELPEALKAGRQVASRVDERVGLFLSIDTWHPELGTICLPSKSSNNEHQFAG
jgi:hypothetical protein